jgi:pimeloyl-ACP methyl ester carboxylesterase
MRGGLPSRSAGVAGVLAIVMAVLMGVAGCSLTGRGASGSSSPASPGSPSASVASPASPTPSSPSAGSSGVHTPPPGQEELASFYAQRLAWSACPGGQCAKLIVPVDYAEPSGPVVRISLLKVPAKGRRVGSLVVNPGGPGGSGVDYAKAADRIVTPAIRSAYDVVGFDPRGVASSAPVSCLDAPQLDAFLGSDPTPDNPGEVTAAVANAKSFAAACKAHAGALLGHVSTIEAAKDMDVLRAALGEKQLTYLGKSYGTFLGATYADLFPKSVGRFVLDGVVAPDLTSEQVNLGQAQGFETATRAYVASCIAQGNCPLGGTVDAGMQRLRDLLTGLDARPIPVTGDPRVKVLTEGWATLGLGFAMYDQRYWPALTIALRQALSGKGDVMMRLADAYADRSASNGSYEGNLLQVISAVNCLDRADSSNPAHYQGDVTKFSTTAPTWGPYLAWGSLTCGYWPFKANNKPKKISATGSGPIVVVGTTRDPATPYAWAQQLAAELKDGHLITYNGDGHTAYMRSNSCVNDAVDGYLLKGTIPSAGLHC